MDSGPIFTRRLRRAGAALAILFFGGCSSLQTTTDPARVYHGDKPVKAATAYYLPKAVFQVSGAPDGENRFVITVATILQPEAERKPFYIRYTPGLFNDDYVRAQVNPSGLLQSVAFMDANPNWNVVAQGALPPVTFSFSAAGKAAAFARRVDPFDARSVDEFNRTLAGTCRLRLRRPRPVQLSTRSKNGCDYDGIVFHPAVPLGVEVASGGETQRGVLPVPDPRVTLAFDFSRGLIDQRGTEIELADGMLTTVHVANQSLVTVILGIPKTILQSVLPIPPGW